jgi:MFS family permease
MTETTSTPPKKAGLRDLLRNRNFRWLWIGQIISNYGDSLSGLALMILVNRLTGSTTALATLIILMVLPQVSVGMLAGVFVDRWNRRRTMIISDILRGILVLGFLLVRKADDLYLLYALSFAQATVGVFFSPARMALLANIVEGEDLLAANSISQTSRILFGLLGTASAGVIIGLEGAFSWVFTINALSFFISAFFTAQISSPKSLQEQMQTSVNIIFSELVHGVRALFSSRTLVGVLITATIVMLGLGAVNVLFVPLLINDLGLPETWFGAIDGAEVAGMILGGAATAALAARLRPTFIIMLGLIVLGIGMGSIAAATKVGHILFIMLPVGLALAPVEASIATLSQTSVSDALRGRVGAALQTMIGAANITSMALAGVLADSIGVRSVFVLAGGLAILAGLMVIPLFGLRHVSRKA